MHLQIQDHRGWLWRLINQLITQSYLHFESSADGEICRRLQRKNRARSWRDLRWLDLIRRYGRKVAEYSSHPFDPFIAQCTEIGVARSETVARRQSQIPRGAARQVDGHPHREITAHGGIE